MIVLNDNFVILKRNCNVKNNLNQFSGKSKLIFPHCTFSNKIELPFSGSICMNSSEIEIFKLIKQIQIIKQTNG